MIIPKSTYIPGQMRADVYFCADEYINDFEREIGHSVSQNVKDIIHDFEGIINDAYQDGYKDGMGDKK